MVYVLNATCILYLSLLKATCNIHFKDDFHTGP